MTVHTPPEPKSNPHWADYIETAMTRRGWDLDDFARASGLAASVIARWRTGQYVPNIPNARKAAQALGVPLLELLVQSAQLTEQEARSYPP